MHIAWREYIVNQLSYYWPQQEKIIQSLPIKEVAEITDKILPPQLIEIPLPKWASNVAVNQMFLVPSHLISNSENNWEKVDWLAVIFWYLNNIAERQFEKLHGSIHSYSYHLKKWDVRLWQYAWVNRIALFLRIWASRLYNTTEEELFGSLSRYEIFITHDVDAVRKTVPIRIKQTIFYITNALRLLSKNNIKGCLGKIHKALQFFFRDENYWYFPELLALEKQYGVKSYFNFYAKHLRKKTFIQWLIDPSYDVMQAPLYELLKALSKNNCEIGLHQSFNAWRNSLEMHKERDYLSQAVTKTIKFCRQHWLRFSWQDTWKAQQDAGFELDMTLGFNDRPGFRNATAIPFQPWNFDENKPFKIFSVPMILMDSHVYDYQQNDSEEILQILKYWLDEVKLVHGKASIIWHTHVLGKDYGWLDGYKALLKLITNTS